MSILEILLTALGLSMDASAVATTIGLKLKTPKLSQAVVVGLYFGVFQSLMPLLGYMLGINFADYIEAYDHWIAFFLLATIGSKMLFEGISKSAPLDDDEPTTGGRKRKQVEENHLAVGKMLPLAIATSIDAMAAGISFAFLRINILLAVFTIGVVTFVLSMVGVALGSAFGSKFKSSAEIAGGVILCVIGLKILLQHMGVISF
jgi:putative Mn2+ efflux pump MntP